MSKTLSLPRTLTALAATAALFLPLAAQAKNAVTGTKALSGGSALSGSGNAVATTDFLFDVSGIFSVDGPGDADNETFSVAVGPNSRIIGIGWNVTLFADSPSWLSEAVVRFGSSSTWDLNLTVGIGDDMPGTMSYSSGGVVDIVDLSLDFSVGADGVLKLEFFESFDDYANDFDGKWESGTLTIRTQPIPEPGTYALMLLGLGAVGAYARRRKA